MVMYYMTGKHIQSYSVNTADMFLFNKQLSDYLQ